jgi:hypothetical protein
MPGEEEMKNSRRNAPHAGCVKTSLAAQKRKQLPASAVEEAGSSKKSSSCIREKRAVSGGGGWRLAAGEEKQWRRHRIAISQAAACFSRLAA